jgi:hypothetical protein
VSVFVLVLALVFVLLVSPTLVPGWAGVESESFPRRRRRRLL